MAPLLGVADSCFSAGRGTSYLAEPPGSRHNGRVFEIVLHQPQIPPNTGNIIRLSANTGARLHLVEPLGFEMSDAKLRRAGLDYRDLARVEIHESWQALRASLAGQSASWYSLSTSGRTTYSEASFATGDVLVFGCEQYGLPQSVLSEFDANHALRVPMAPGSRSLNLANTVAVVVYEAWRHVKFTGSADAEG
jgi:tRNA (cytidine/uridine-2'-O-)-methyltransferase